MSQTKIELEHPYNQDWKSGYLNTNKEGRKTLVLYNNNTDRSSTQYARYLLAVELGRYLTEEEQVDHIDDDKTNDSLENLQILSRKDNIKKEANRRPCTKVEIRCPVCKLPFKKLKGHTQLLPSLKGKVTCCCRDCSFAFKKLNFDKELRDLISEETILS